LDLGYGLNLQSYTQLIEDTRHQIEQYNVLLSHLDEARKNVLDMEKQLSTFSERMLAGILVKYGRSSKEYSKAGGATRRGKPLKQPLTQMHQISQISDVMESTGNAPKVLQAALN
jgi:hypothetical protein